MTTRQCGAAVTESYGVWAEKSMYGRTYWGALRTTFVIDTDGTVAKVLEAVKPATHDEQVLEALAALVDDEQRRAAVEAVARGL